MTAIRLSRRLFIIGLVGGIGGCLNQLRGSQRSDDNIALQSATHQGDLQLTSPAFEAGEQIPSKHGYDEANVNPPLEISRVPSEAESLVLVMDDPDAVDVAGKIWVHWLVWNIPPATTSIPEDWSPSNSIEGENDFGEVGYGGPSPPDEPHTYRFKLFPLDQILDLERGSPVDQLGPQMEDHVLAQTQLTGTYPA